MMETVEGNDLKLLLTSSGIANDSIRTALTELLGKPVEESSALFVPTGMYPFPGGGTKAWEAVSGATRSRLSAIGWKSFGILELTTLASIPEESWIPTLRETDALLVWGGHVMYLSYWLRRSGLVDLLPTLDNLVYVGVSAGSIALTPYNCDAEWNLQFVTPQSEIAELGDRATGLVDFALCVHLDNPDPMFEDSSMANIEKWAAQIPIPTYAIDDQTALKISGSTLEVVSEGNWRLFRPEATKD